jgi:hypothetical protein
MDPKQLGEVGDKPFFSLFYRYSKYCLNQHLACAARSGFYGNNNLWRVEIPADLVHLSHN